MRDLVLLGPEPPSAKRCKPRRVQSTCARVLDTLKATSQLAEGFLLGARQVALLLAWAK